MFDWWKAILGFRSATPSAPAESSPTASTTILRLDDAPYSANADILDGMRFGATLQIRTSLSVLEHHGEIFRGPPSKAPVYGTGADGIWVFNVAGDIGDVFSTGASHASDVGSVNPDRYLPFLKQFRTIVEADTPHEDKLAALAELPLRSEAFAEFWRKLEGHYAGFPHSFFYMQLTSLPGVGRTTAMRLYEAGLRTVAEVSAAPDESLSAIPGVGTALIAKIRAATSREVLRRG